MMRRVLMAIYGLAVGACFAALLHVAFPGKSALMPVRGLNVVLLMVLYGWCCGKDPLLSIRRPLVEIPLIPFALFGAAIAGCACLVAIVVTRLSLLVGRRSPNGT